MAKITKDMIIHKAMKMAPSAVKVFDSYHMGCKSCSGGKYETVEWGAVTHGVDIKELLTKLNVAPKKG